MAVKTLTPVLFVEKIEAVLPFWMQHLGFIKTVEVPEGDRLAFVILQQGSAEVNISILRERRGGPACYRLGRPKRSHLPLYRG